MKKIISNWGYILAAVFILATTVVHSRWDNNYTEAPISWDVSGYYCYLPSIFIYKDIKQLDFLPKMVEKYRPSPTRDQAFQHESGNFIFKYSAGQSITFLPGFTIGHLWAKNSDKYPADGFSRPYQVSVYWSSLLFGLLGLFLLYLSLQFYFGNQAANWVIFLLAAGTNLLEYASYTAMMTHMSLFSLYALLIYLSRIYWEKKSIKQAIAIGLTCGLMTLIRPTEIIALLIPILWDCPMNKRALTNRLSYISGTPLHFLTAGIFFAIVVLLQSLYWKLSGDQFIIYSYQDQGFSWLKPHIKNVLFSFRKGWLIYTPLMIIALIGFIPLWKKHKRLFLACFAFFSINFYIVSAWDIWWYGGSFGQRALVQSYAILAFPMAASMQYLIKRKRKFLLLAPFILFCIILNNFQIWQSHTYGLFEAEYTNKAYYWRMFFKTEYDPVDKLLLDNKDSFRGEKKDYDIVLSEDFESDSNNANIIIDEKKGSRVERIQSEQMRSELLKIDIENQNKQWVHIRADFKVDQKEYDIWNMARLFIEFKKGDKVVKKRHIKFPRLLESDQWKTIEMDCKFPSKEIDHIQCYVAFSKPSPKSYFWDDIEIAFFNE